MFQKGHQIRNQRDPSKPARIMKTLTKPIQKYGKYTRWAREAISSKGRDLYLLYAEKNVLLSPKQAITAQCAHCSGWYVDGKLDCENGDCPLYPYMPYGKYRKIRNQKKEVPDVETV